MKKLGREEAIQGNDKRRNILKIDPVRKVKENHSKNQKGPEIQKDLKIQKDSKIHTENLEETEEKNRKTFKKRKNLSLILLKVKI